jgi:hypothetical protein
MMTGIGRWSRKIPYTGPNRKLATAAMTSEARIVKTSAVDGA